MNYKFHKNGSFNIHTIKTNRFKNVRMEIIFRNNFKKEEILARKALFNILVSTNNTYKTRLDLLKKREELYDAYIYSSGMRIDGSIVNKICLDFLNPRYVDDKNYLEEVISLPFDLIFNPLLEDDHFSNSLLTEQKLSLKSNIESIKNNPSLYSVHEALKYADSKSLFSYNDTIEDLNQIDTKKLYELYLNILKHDYIDIFIVGDIDEDKIIDLINKYAKWNTIKNHELLKNNPLSRPSSIKKKRKKGDFLQTQLVYVLSINPREYFDKQYSANLYNSILGGDGLESILSKNLREENSICYSISSFYQKSDGLIVIYTSLDKSDLKLASSLISSSINKLKKGKIDESSLENAKKAIISSLCIKDDDEESIISEYLMRYLNVLEPMDKRIDNYKKVTKEDIVRVAKGVKIHTIYTLENGDL